LATKLIDDGEHAERPSIEQLIVYKAHAPTLVSALSFGSRTSMQAHMFSSSYAHPQLQALEPV
jgi:hypothetical protein